MPVNGPSNTPPIHPSVRPSSTGPATEVSTSTGLQLTNPAFDLNSTFETGRADRVVLPPAVQDRVTAALESYQDTLRSTLHHDAMSLAEGHSPVRAGDHLTDAQVDELKDATKDMFMSMPIGALSPSATAELRGLLEREGIEVDNLETKTLGDLGDIGGDLAKKWADDLKENSPGVFYGALAAGAAAVGAYGILQGSEALKDLGIKPEFKTSLFNKALSIKAEGMWGKNFSDPNIRANLNGRVNLNPLSLRISSTIDARNLDDTTLGLGARIGDNQRYLDVEANADRNGLQDLTVNGRWSNDRVTAFGSATFDQDLALDNARLGVNTRWNDSLTTDIDMKFGENWEPASAGGRLSYRNGDKFRLDAEARHYFGEGRTTADLTASYTPTRDLELGIKGGYDSDQGGRIGVGLTWRF